MFLKTNQQLRKELAQTQARLRMIEATIARERDSEFDNQTYAAGYRAALRVVAQVTVTGKRYMRPVQTRARQSQTTVRSGSTADRASGAKPVFGNEVM